MPSDISSIVGELVLNIVLLIALAVAVRYGIRYLQRRAARKPEPPAQASSFQPTADVHVNPPTEGPDSPDGLDNP